MTPQSVSSQLGNSSNGSGSCQEENQHMSLIVLLCLVFFLGFLLNGFSLWVFWCRMPRWTSGTTLQFHLAISDAIATSVIPMLAVYFIMGNKWPFGWFMCQVDIALLSSYFYGSTIFLTLISIHRYEAVVHFNKSSCMKRKPFVQKLCAGVWFLLLIQALVYAVVLRPSKESSQCLSIRERNLTDTYFVINIVQLICGFLLPFVVSVVCYTCLAGSLTHHNISIAQGLKVKVKSLRMIGLCLVIFGLCFLPLSVIKTVVVVLKKHHSEECIPLPIENVYRACWILAAVNSCLDPLLYCFGSQNFRDAVKSLRIVKEDAPNRSDSEMSTNQ